MQRVGAGVAPVDGHAGHLGPLVSGRVVALHGVEPETSVVAAARVDVVVEVRRAHVAARRVHGGRVVPPLLQGVKVAHAVVVVGAIETTYGRDNAST